MAITRIKNNQITDSTIFANTKIAAGSIVGSLFNSNLTMSSDVTITGNLTVQGGASYSTIASTNTYVNDPMIVLNNSYSGSNTYDVGLLFNRGNDTAVAIHWDESADEFVMTYTTEDGTTYGDVAIQSFANVKMGNVTVEYDLGARNLTASGTLDVTGTTTVEDLAVNGGDITTDETTFNLVNGTATTLNVGGAASTINMGASGGTMTVANDVLDVDGDVNIDGGDLTSNQTSFNLLNTGVTTLNLGGAATTLTLGATSGTTTIQSAELQVDGNLTVDGSLTITALDGTPVGATTPSTGAFTTLDATGATSLGLTDATAINNTPIGNATPSTGAFTTLDASGTTTLGATSADSIDSTPIGASTPSTGAFTTLDATGATSLGLTDATAINSTPIGNATPSTGAFTTLSATGSTTVEDIAVNGGDITTDETTFNLVNTNATTVNFAGAATDLTMGSTSGTTTIQTAEVQIDGNLTIDGSLAISALDGTPVGATTPDTGAFTTLDSTGATSLGLTDATAINSTPIGNATPSTGAFTTLDASGTTTLGATSADSIDSTPIGASTPSTGAFTTASTTGEATLASATVQDLTDNRVTFAGTGGVLEDSDDLTFDGTDLAVGASDGSNVKVGVDGTVTATGTVEGATLTDGTASLASGSLTSAVNVTASGTVQGGTLTDGTASINAGAVSGVTTLGTSGEATLASATVSDLTAGRVVLAGTSGAVEDDINLTYATDVLTVANIDIDGTAGATTISTGTDDDLILAPGGAGVIDVNATNITNLADPTLDSDAVTLSYLNSALGSSVSAIVNDDSDVTVYDDGVSAGYIEHNVDGTLVANVDSSTFAITANTSSTTTTTGALTVAGGVGVAENVTVGGQTKSTDTTDSTNVTTGAIITAGGVGIAKNLNVGGDVSITGNLTVEGTTTSVNSTTLDVADLNITIADGAADSASADGAGLTVDGANATLLYTHATTSWDLNKITKVTDTTDSTSPTTGALLTAGGLGVAKDLFVGGGDLGTDQTTFNLINTTATTLNIGGAATTLELGASSGTTSVNNNLDVDADLNVDGGDLTTNQTTFNLLNTNATTVNFAGAGTAITIGAATGTTTIQNAEVQVDGNLTVDGSLTITALDGTPVGATTPDTGAFTTLDSTGATSLGLTDATAINSTPIGNATPSTGAFTNLSATGTTTVEDIAVNGGDITTDETTFNLVNTTATTLNIGGAATAVTLGAATGTTTIQNAEVQIDGNLTVDGSLTITALDGTPIGATTPDTGAFTTLDSTGATSLGLTDATAINNTPIGNATPSTGAFTNLSATGTTTVEDIAVNGGDITTDETTFNLVNTTATTVNFAGAATTVEIGAATGTTSVNNDLAVDGTLDVTGATTLTDDLAVNGGDLTTTAGTFNLVNTNATTVNFAGAATDLTLGATSGTTTIQNAEVQVDGNLTIDGSLTLSALDGTPIGATTPDTGAFTTLDSTGATSLGLTDATAINNTPIGNATPSTGAFTNLSATGTTTVEDIAVNGGDITTDETTFNLVNTTATTVNFAGAATTLELGASSGTTSVNNDLAVDGTLDVTGATNLNDTTSSTNTTTGALIVDGGLGLAENLNVGGKANVAGIVNITDTTASDSYNDGALVVGGGVGVAGNIHVQEGYHLAVGEGTAGAYSFDFDKTIASFTGNVDSFAQITVQNVNTGTSASSDITIMSDIAGDNDGFIDFGIANSNYDGSGNGTDYDAGDAFAIAYGNASTGGDLVIGTAKESTELRLLSGAATSANVVAKVKSAGGLQFEVTATDNATSATTGALKVDGGAGIAKDLFVGESATFNPANGDHDFTVKGSYTDTLIYADASLGQVVIGGSNTATPGGTTLKVNGTDAMLIPVGTTSQRPGSSGNVDVAGMIRYNSTSTALEYHNGTEWKTTSSEFTVITSDQFTGNAVATEFTLSESSTTAGTIVSVNGIVQIPTTAYSISGTTLTFTEAPGDGDVVDARTLTTTQTINELASGNGYNAFIANADGIFGSTGTSSAIERFQVTTAGVLELHNDTKIAVDTDGTTVGASATTIDTFATSAYRSAKYLVTAENAAGTDWETAEIMLIHDGTTATITVYGVTATGSDTWTYSATISGGNVLLQATAGEASTTVKVHPTYIK